MATDITTDALSEDEQLRATDINKYDFKTKNLQREADARMGR